MFLKTKIKTEIQKVNLKDYIKFILQEGTIFRKKRNSRFFKKMERYNKKHSKECFLLFWLEVFLMEKLSIDTILQNKNIKLNKFILTNYI